MRTRIALTIAHGLWPMHARPLACARTASGLCTHGLWPKHRSRTDNIKGAAQTRRAGPAGATPEERPRSLAVVHDPGRPHPPPHPPPRRDRRRPSPVAPAPAAAPAPLRPFPRVSAQHRRVPCPALCFRQSRLLAHDLPDRHLESLPAIQDSS